MIKVLQVLGGTCLGGAESRVMDIYRHIDRDKIQFDFLINEGVDGPYSEEIEKLGGHVYHLPRYKVYNYFKYRSAIREFFREHKDYAVVHGHMTSTAAWYLPEAKKAGIPLTIAHARSAGVDKGAKGRLTRFMRRHLSEKCDMMLACSDQAAVSVFGQKALDEGRVVFMPNAVDTGEFAPDTAIGHDIRKQYGLKGTFLVGHVGRLHYAKNHEFLLKVFKEVAALRDDARLLIVGEGPLENDIRQWIEEMGLKDKAIMAGAHTPVSPYYKAFDCVVFPSRYEGMPGTVVEAQAAGLPCLISDKITPQVKASDLVEFMSLEDDPKNWALKLLEMCENKTYLPKLSDTLFDVHNQITYYTELYSKAAAKLEDK